MAGTLPWCVALGPTEGSCYVQSQKRLPDASRTHERQQTEINLLQESTYLYHLLANFLEVGYA